MKKYQKTVVKLILFAIFIINVYCTYIGEVLIGEKSIYFTFYIFLLGFILQSFISLNLTNAAKKLKQRDSFKSIASFFKKVMLFMFVGLLVTVVSIEGNKYFDIILFFIFIINIYYLIYLYYSVFEFMLCDDE